MTNLENEIIFVYNAKSDLFSALGDLVHKMLFPSTYPCSLCQLTYGHSAIKKEWAQFLDTLPFRKTFLHKDETTAIDPAFLEELPVILIRTKTRGLETLMGAHELNQSHGLGELIDTLGKRLEKYNVP